MVCRYLGVHTNRIYNMQIYTQIVIITGAVAEAQLELSVRVALRSRHAVPDIHGYVRHETFVAHGHKSRDTTIPRLNYSIFLNK